MTVEVARDKKAKAMTFREGVPGKLEEWRCCVKPARNQCTIYA